MKVYTMRWHILLFAVITIMVAGCENIRAHHSGLARIGNTGDIRIEQARLGDFEGSIDQAIITSDGHRVIVAMRLCQYTEPNRRNRMLDILFNPGSGLGDAGNYASKTINVWDPDLHIFRVRSGQLIKTLPTKAQRISLSSNDRWLLTLDSKNLLRRWDLDWGQHTDPLIINGATGDSDGPVAISSDGSRAAVVLRNHYQEPGIIVLVDLERLTILHRIYVAGKMDEEAVVKSLRFSPDNRLLAVETSRYAHLVDTTTGDILPILPKGTRGLWFVENNHLLAVSRDSVDRLDNSTGKLIRRYPIQVGNKPLVVISPDGLHIAATTDNSMSIQVWDLTAETLAYGHFETPGRINTMRFSADGQQLYTVNDEWKFRKITLKPTVAVQNTPTQ